VTWLRIQRPRNPGSTPVQCKRFISAPKLADRFWGPPSVPREEVRLMVPPGGGGVKRLRRQADHHYLVPRFRMCGVIPLFLPMRYGLHGTNLPLPKTQGDWVTELTWRVSPLRVPLGVTANFHCLWSSRCRFGAIAGCSTLNHRRTFSFPTTFPRCMSNHNLNVLLCFVKFPVLPSRTSNRPSAAACTHVKTCRP
jgi:hypothetical protein